MIANKKIRQALFDTGIRHYQLAKALGISENTLGRMLRQELPDEKQEELLKLIKEMEVKRYENG